MIDNLADLIEVMERFLAEGRGLIIRNHHFGAAYINAGGERYDFKSYLRKEFDMCLDELRLGKVTNFYVLSQDYSWIAHYKLSLHDSKFQLARV